jgi:hypothetical protein
MKSFFGPLALIASTDWVTLDRPFGRQEIDAEIWFQALLPLVMVGVPLLVLLFWLVLQYCDLARSGKARKRVLDCIPPEFPSGQQGA